MEKKLTEEFKAEYSAQFRENYLTMMHKGINTMIDVLGETKEVPDNQISQLKRQVAEQLADDIMAISAVTSAIKLFGKPKSLIIIIPSGQAIDLLKIKDLNQEAAFDELLDNLKIG